MLYYNSIIYGSTHLAAKPTIEWQAAGHQDFHTSFSNRNPHKSVLQLQVRDRFPPYTKTYLRTYEAGKINDDFTFKDKKLLCRSDERVGHSKGYADYIWKMLML